MGDHRFNPRARGTHAQVRHIFRDAYGRPVDEMAEVIGHQIRLQSPRFLVRAIRPNLAPDARPGTLSIVLDARITIVVEADKPVQDFILTRTAEETGYVKPTDDAEEDPTGAGAATGEKSTDRILEP